MVNPAKLWRILPPSAARETLSRDLGISPLVAQLLVNRGYEDVTAAQLFLHGGAETLGDPFLLKGVAAAVERIKYALDNHQNITIYGDYDVDGVTATALLYTVLKRLGAEVGYYIPERQSEGYGLNENALAALSQTGTKLLITVDCGISAVSEVASMAGRMDIIITDHHQPSPEIPDCLAVINPKQADCRYPDKNLAGVGVAYKLCQALWHYLYKGEVFTDYLDLVAVGTIADIVSLTGENRVMVKLGLHQLAVTDNLGLKALLKVCNLADSKIDAGKVGFIIAPRLNAAGRLSHAAAGVELLVTDDAARSAELATELNNENLKRQTIEKELLTEAEQLLGGIDINTTNALVLAGQNWHPGVIGIVASRVVEKIYRPTVMISIKDGIGKGSCRSIPGFNIYQGLEQCADLLLQFGGHQQAAGFSIAEANIDAFRQRLNTVAGQCLKEEDFRPAVKIDAEVGLEEINAALIEQLACLAPYGMGNPSPVFMAKNLVIDNVRSIGQDGRHLKLKVKRRNSTNDVVAWEKGALADQLANDGNVDLVFVPEFNEWQGRRLVQLRAHDLKSRTVVPDQVALVDARNSADKFTHILDASAQGKTLIYTNCRHSAIALVQKIRTQRLAAKPRLSILYPGMAESKRQRTAAKWQQQTTASLIVAGELAGVLGAVSRIIFYDPPCSAAVMRSFLAVAAKADRPVTVSFLFGRAESIAADKFIAALYPDRTAIGQVYLSLKQLQKQRGEIALTDAALSRQVELLAGHTEIAYSLNSALEILAELGLLRQDITVAKRIIYLAPAPAGKLDLNTSAIYRNNNSVRSNCANYIREITTAPLVQIWQDAVLADGG
jgi:single-stranded-DNA-specific exonuclease